jgi:uncharacterized protein (DUF362 family)
MVEPVDAAPRRREMLLRVARLGGAGACLGGAAWWLSERSRRPEEPLVVNVRRDHTVAREALLADMSVVQGDAPGALVRRAVEELGGMGRFISRGDVVVIKPNIGWDRTPEQAANTNPEIVAEVAGMCFEAGAKSVLVADVPVNEPRRCFARSGIEDAARRAGATVVLPEDRKLKEAGLGGEVLNVWPVLEPFLAADKMINIPIAKHHSLTGSTLGMKNWYGILGGVRHRLHQRIHESLADLAAFMRPTLTIVDAYRVLIRNGPTGGNLADVLLKKTVIASIDPVAADAYAAKAYWNIDADRMPYLKFAADRGLGTANFESLRTRIAHL